jgi:hypothetical protein
MLAALELLLITWSGGEFEPERVLTEASYGARNWLVSLANTLKKEKKKKQDCKSIQCTPNGLVQQNEL